MKKSFNWIEPTNGQMNSRTYQKPIMILYWYQKKGQAPRTSVILSHMLLKDLKLEKKNKRIDVSFEIDEQAGYVFLAFNHPNVNAPKFTFKTSSKGCISPSYNRPDLVLKLAEFFEISGSNEAVPHEFYLKNMGKDDEGATIYRLSQTFAFKRTKAKDLEAVEN